MKTKITHCDQLKIGSLYELDFSRLKGRVITGLLFRIEYAIMYNFYIPENKYKTYLIENEIKKFLETGDVEIYHLL